MAEDPEKKFISIMNKLFQSPPSNLFPSSRSSNILKTRGVKRPHAGSELSSKGDGNEGVPNAAQAPPCRPWDRGDLMRRLATFKSMRWFAKPKDMDAVNCARRGWINVDIDIIACEVCGARLQFSTPSAWSQQQVEKAARVFSVKLDSGHKLLCPWTNNACDEKLALFPPLPAAVLVGRYKERSKSLLHLSALPVISASAKESMKSPQMEHFLKESIAVECGAGPNGSSWREYLGNDLEAVSANLYYQAHRLLSLCGWEPRLLPYIVDSIEQPKQLANDKDPSSLSPTVASEKSKLCVHVSGSGMSGEETEHVVAPIVHYDPNSTVLDCKLCGASIGLWAFMTVPRPLELIKVVGYSDFDSRSEHGNDTSKIGNCGNDGKTNLSTLNKEATFSKETTLNFSIAGGPPATKQNFKATISLPVVGRNVRARFSSGTSVIRYDDQEEHASPNAIVEGSVEIGSNGAGNLLNIEDSGASNQGASHSDPPTDGLFDSVSQDNVAELHVNDVESEKSSSVVNDSSNVQHMPSKNVSPLKDTLSLLNAGQKENGVVDVSAPCTETDLRRLSSDKKMEFDPVRQHRHFCPWIASTGTSALGWQQTLSALLKEKVFSLPESEDIRSSPSLIKVDDPITSIRLLFESPPSKKLKPTST